MIRSILVNVFKQQFGVAPSVYLRGKEESGIQDTENKD